MCHVCLTSTQMDVIKVDYTTCKYVRFYQSDTHLYTYIYGIQTIVLCTLSYHICWTHLLLLQLI